MNLPPTIFDYWRDIVHNYETPDTIGWYIATGPKVDIESCQSNHDTKTCHHQNKENNDERPNMH